MIRKAQNIREQLLPLVFQTVGGIVILLVVWLVVAGLPMIRDLHIPVYFTAGQLASAVFLTIIMMLLVGFGTRMEARLAAIVTAFPQSGLLVKWLAFLIVIAIAYGAYQPLLEPYWGDFYWVYPLVFLIGFLAVLGNLGYTMYRNMDRLGGLFAMAKATVPTPTIAAGLIFCAGCGEKNEVGGGFCSSCGAKLSPPETVSSICKGCGAALKPNARFCASCGFTVAA